MKVSSVLREITPLAYHDFMYVADRHKKEFTYPIHCHEIFELNFVENGEGCRRTVGDSSEIIGQYDLVLITSPQLEHVWEQHECKSPDIHEVTVQFFVDYTDEHSSFHTNPFSSIYKMFVRAQRGLAFPMAAIMQVYPMIIRLSSIKEGFYAMRELFTILYELSKQDGARELSSSAFAKVDDRSDSRRVLKVKNYIEEHYREELRLSRQGRTSTNTSSTSVSDMLLACWWTPLKPCRRYAMILVSTPCAISTVSSASARAATLPSSVKSIARRKSSCDHK